MILFSAIIHSEPVGIVGYVTQKGEALLNRIPPVKIKSGMELDREDTILLKEGAKIRVDFYPVSESKIFSADAELNMNDILQDLSNKKGKKDQKGAIVSELDRLKKQYFAPKYSHHAGTRSIEIFVNAVVHSEIQSWRRDPHLVFRTFGKKTQTKVLSESGSEVVFQSEFADNQAVSVLQCEDATLSYGQTYQWMLNPQGANGTLTLCSEKRAKQVQSELLKIKGKAIDQLDQLILSALYLHQSAFWAEAYALVQEGLKINPNEIILKNLRNHLLQFEPEETFYEEALNQADTVLVDFTFHIFHKGKKREVTSGDTVYTNDRLQIGLKTRQDTYLYLMNLDAGGNIYVLFPHEGKDHFIPAQSDFFVPSHDKYFLADAQTGNEILYVVASQYPLDFLSFKLDQMVQESKAHENIQMLESFTSRGFSAVTQREYEVKDEDPFKRVLKGKGLFVRKIVLNHF